MTGLATLWPRLLAYGAIALLCAGLGAGLVYRLQARQIAELTAKVKAADAKGKVDQKVSEKRAKVRSQRVAETAAQEAKEAAAVKANPVWADQPLPQEVIDAMAE